MTIFIHECRQGRKSLWIWTISIALFMVMCVFLYPEMEGEMANVNEMYSSLGAFSEAFGMDRLDFGTLLGFYAVECGNIVSVGGALFAAMVGAEILAKEQKEHTAEFLFSHPAARSTICLQKLAAVIYKVTALNVIVAAASIGSIAAIGESIPWKELCLLHLAYYLCQIELAFICFGISAFITGGSVGIGMGLALAAYFMNVLANVSDKAKICKTVSPFGYTEGADILEKVQLDGKLILPGLAVGILAVVIGILHYSRKDLQ